METTAEARESEQEWTREVGRFLPEEIRAGIEQRYYARVNQQATLEHLAHDAEFLSGGATHVALYSDHGVVHVRDVAWQILHVLEVIPGVLIPNRTAIRLEFMRGYGVVEAYLHDIGVSIFSHFGREMHPEYATQEVFRPHFENWIDRLWNENWGNLAWRLSRLHQEGALPQDPKLVLREMLAMANCHSKSKVPIAALNERTLLRQTMQQTLGTNLSHLYNLQQKERAWRELLQATQSQQEQATIDRLGLAFHEAETRLEAASDDSQQLNLDARKLYEDFERESFAWLLSERETVAALAEDVIDTLRALRCADALRQRGTVLKTSGGYEIFTDQLTGNAIYALRDRTGKAYLLETDNILSAGEANMASSDLTRDGDMRVAFHRGAFPTLEITHRAAFQAAVVVNDVQGDIIESFQRAAALPGAPASHKAAGDIQILIESVEDNREFAELVCRALAQINPPLAGRARPVASLHGVSAHERERYLSAEAFPADEEPRRALLAKVAECGHKTSGMDALQAFQDVRQCALRVGEVLVEAGVPAGFVYLPLGPGLKGKPLGGYAPFDVPAWVPLSTGVIRGDVRNSTLIAERDVSILIIPKETYLRHWHRTYTIQEFTQMLANALITREQPLGT